MRRSEDVLLLCGLCCPALFQSIYRMLIKLLSLMRLCTRFHCLSNAQSQQRNIPIRVTICRVISEFDQFDVAGGFTLKCSQKLRLSSNTLRISSTHPYKAIVQVPVSPTDRKLRGNVYRISCWRLQSRPLSNNAQGKQFARNCYCNYSNFSSQTIRVTKLN